METYYLIMYWEHEDEEISAYTTDKRVALAKLAQLLDRNLEQVTFSIWKHFPPANAVNLDQMPSSD